MGAAQTRSWTRLFALLQSPAGMSRCEFKPMHLMLQLATKSVVPTYKIQVRSLARKTQTTERFGSSDGLPCSVPLPFPRFWPGAYQQPVLMSRHITKLGRSRLRRPITIRYARKLVAIDAHNAIPRGLTGGRAKGVQSSLSPTTWNQVAGLICKTGASIHSSSVCPNNQFQWKCSLAETILQ